MNIKRTLSYVLGIAVGLVAVAPPIPFSIPVMINSEIWLYSFIIAALFGVFVLSKGLPNSLKVLVQYLFLGCFISMVPYVSFNAYILVVGSAYIFLAFLNCERKVILDFVLAVFILEVFIGTLQLFGVDKLMNFNRPDPVFVGTVCQYMRFGALLAMLSPLLVLKNKWFIIPIGIVAIVSKTSSFGLAVISGVVVYFLLTHKKQAIWAIVVGILGISAYCLWDKASFQIAITDGRFPVWCDIVKSWIFDTSRCEIPIAKNYINCAIDYKSIFFGRGLDTFLPLFPIFKQDPNPFPQAHCSYLQFLWEFGLVGMTIISVYVVGLVKRLYKAEAFLYISGLVCIGTNMMFAFPERQTQCMLLILCFVAFCERKAREKGEI